MPAPRFCTGRIVISVALGFEPEWHYFRKPLVSAVWRAVQRAHTPGGPSHLPAYFAVLMRTPWSHRSGPRDIYPAYANLVPVAIPPPDRAEKEMHRWTCASRP